MKSMLPFFKSLTCALIFLSVTVWAVSCGDDISDDTPSSAASVGTSSLAFQESTESEGKTGSEFAGSETDEPSGYTSEELCFSNEDKNIYGKIYLPENVEGRIPAVILSHSFGLDHSSMEGYCAEFASMGYAAYCFDFCGGGKNSESDGDMEDMTVFTEVSDLEAVLAGVKELEYIDPGKIFLFGTSQGGLVSALTAAAHPDDAAGMILFYPAFNIPEAVEGYDPSSSAGMGGMTSIFGTVGEEYVSSLDGYDVYGAIGGYTGPVLIVHGTEDPIVSPEYSERAADVYENAQLKMISGAGHGFNAENYSMKDDYDGEAMGYVREFLGGLE